MISVAPCPCAKGGGRRTNGPRSVLPVVVVAAIGRGAPRAAAFRQQNRYIRDGDGDGDAAPDGSGGRGAFLRSPLQSLARVAERGASKWGDYVPARTSSMEQSSSLYLSQLHRRVGAIHSGQGLDRNSIESGDMKKKIKDAEDEMAPPAPERLIQEALSYILGSVVVGSAFAAATAGAFLVTSVIALGSLATVIFVDDKDEVKVHLLDRDDYVVDGYAEHTHTAGSESCDFNGVEQDEKKYSYSGGNVLRPTTNGRKKLDSFMLEELKKCYNGISDHSMFPLSQKYPEDVCVIDIDGNGGNSAHETSFEVTEKEFLYEYDETAHGKTQPSSADALQDTRVEVVWHDAFDGVSYAHYYTTETPPTRGNARHRLFSRRASSKPTQKEGMRKLDTQSSDEHWADLSDAERDGALLLSESLRFVSSAFELAANAVRFTGETAAATAGGTARLVGSAVRLSGWAVLSLGEAIENREELHPDGGKIRKRQVAGKSVRLVGDAIEQVAESLLLAGSATEHVAFAAAAAAEGTVQIVGDFASSLSASFSAEGRRGQGSEFSPPINKKASSGKDLDFDGDELMSNLIKKGLVNMEGTMESTAEKHNHDQADGDIADLLRAISSWVVANANAINAETAGVQSLSSEILIVFVTLFLASIFLFAPKRDFEAPDGIQNKLVGKVEETGLLCKKNESPKEIFFADEEQKTPAHNEFGDHSSHSTITVESTLKTEPDFGRGRFYPSSSPFCKRVTGSFFFLILVPLKLVWAVSAWLLKFVFSKEASLLVMYTIGWITLSRASQHKSSIIQRKSELSGYRAAIESIGKSSSGSESALWLNGILSKLWKVESGGLEPLLSSFASASLTEVFQRSYTKPSVVGQVALEAFTFGSTPPIITRIELKDTDADQSAIFMDVDVGILQHDALLLLDIRPSTLDYRSIPSTTVCINSLDAKTTLSVHITCSGSYPYISSVNISLVEIPDFNLRIEPQSESGLKGIDFGSFPIVSKWIKRSINSALSGYLPPHYISLDILAWLSGEGQIVTYF